MYLSFNIRIFYGSLYDSVDICILYMQSGFFCIIVDALIKLEIYSDYVQV
jgi:hypothetical protein